MQNGSASSTGQSYGIGMTLKHVTGPWLLAGALSLGGTNTHTSRPAILGGTMQSDSNAFTGGARLRGAYEFAFAGWYARPRLDLDLYYSSQGAYQEYGQDPVGLAFGGYAKVNTAIAPALELGGRIDMGAAILRPYLTAGATFLPDNTRTIDIGFTGVGAQVGTVRMIVDGPSVLGVFEAGLQLYRARAWEVKADYRIAVGDSYLSQGVGLRGAVHF